jgi:hypothetical protein
MPANGWWHEWTFNYDLKVENNVVHLDLAEREAKILVCLGENYDPSAPKPKPDASSDATATNASSAAEAASTEQ